MHFRLYLSGYSLFVLHEFTLREIWSFHVPALTGGKEMQMKKRVAVISVIVENAESVEELNRLLSTCREEIIGRMGIPYREKKVSLISVAIDAPEDTINALTGKIGRLPGVSAKTNYSNIITEC
jgi:putative iron-only hydrogenase system regulator